MKTLTHAAAQDWILSGRGLKPEEAADLSDHLAGCAECRRFAAFHQELLAAVPGVTPSITHTEGELRQRIASVKTRLKPRSASARFFHVTRAVAFPLSAVAVIILLAFLIVRLIPEQTRLTPGGAGTPSPVQSSATAAPTQAPTPTPVADPFQSVLDVFPLVPGAQWTYTDTEYAPAPDDPAKTVQGVFEITDRVVEAQAAGPAYFAHIQRRVTQLNADPAWAAQAQNPPVDAEWWYIVNAGQVYSSPVMPSDPQNFPYNSLTLEFQLPLKVDAKWCPNRGTRGFADPSIPTPQPCTADIGARIVRSAAPYQSAAGSFPTCYLLDDVYNTGDTLQTFCDGAGVVARKFDHPGTRFGYAWELKSFSSSAAVEPTPTPPASAPAVTPLAVLAQRGGSVQGVALSGSTAYIGSGPRLSALDVSDPSAPRLLAQSEPLPGLVSGVVLFPAAPKMQAAAVSAGRYVEVLDISQADKIVRVNEVALPGTINAMVLDTTNWKLYAGGFINQGYDSNAGYNLSGYVAVVDLQGGISLGQVRQLTGLVGSLALTQGMLYAGNMNGSSVAVTGIPLLSPTRLGEPQPVITAVDPALEIYSLQTAGNRLYVGSYSAMLAYDISNPAAPIEKWRATQDDAGNPLMMVQGFVLHANRIDMAGLVPSGGMGGPWQASLTPPEAVPVDSGSAAASITAGDSARLYVTRDGLRIFDAGTPQVLKPLGVYQPPLIYTIDQAANGDLLYTLDTDSSSHNWAQFLHVLRLPGLETVGEYRFAGPDDAPGWEYYSGMALEGNRLYVFDLHKGTWAFDLSDPLKPALLNRPGVFSDGLSAAAAADSAGRRLLFKSSPQSASPNTLDVYDVTDLDNIAPLSSLDLKTESVRRMRWSGNTLYAVTQANPDAGNDFTFWFYIIGLENGALKIQYRMQLEADASLAAQGSLVALAEPQKLILLSAAEPALTQVIKYQTPLSAPPAGLDFLGDRLMVSMLGSTSQLLIFDLSNPLHPALAYALDVPYTERLSTSAPYAVLSAGSSGITVLK